MTSTQAALALTSADARVVEHMSFEDYAAVDALNGSSIVNMRRSPMYFKYVRDNPCRPRLHSNSARTLTGSSSSPIARATLSAGLEDMGRRFGKEVGRVPG